jgi:ADP-glucose pyrophosphorylase
MGLFSVVVVVKNKEPGLLSIAEKREKALVPLLNGAKIIDCYLSPFCSREFGKVSVIMEKAMTGVREHVMCNYSTNSVRVIHEANVIASLFQSFSGRKRCPVILLRADGLLLPQWNDFIGFLKKLPDGNYTLQAPGKKVFGFYFQDTSVLNALENENADFGTDDSPVDRMWELISDIFHKLSKPVEYNTRYDTLETVADYYRVQFDLFRRFGELPVQQRIPPPIGLDEEEGARITEHGHVVNAYVAFSSMIEGFVKGSVIFPHVRVGRNARVIDSVIMDHNHIGSGAAVANTILCDNSELFSKVTPNVGENAFIGEEDNRGENAAFPRFLHGGITLIGQNVEIPKAYKISRNCYIASNTHRSLLKEHESIKAGESVLSV